MNIVFIGPFGLQPKATMNTRAIPLAKALVGRGHKVTVLIPPWDDPERAGQNWEEDGVQVVNVPLPEGLFSRLPLLFHIILTRTLVAYALELEPQIIHCFKPKAYAGLVHFVLWLLRRLRQRLLIRLVVDADDWEQAWNEVLPYSVLEKRFFAWQEKWGLRHADAITVASRALIGLVTSRVSVDPAQIFYVPNGCRRETISGLQAEGSGIDSDRVRALRQRWQLGDAPTVLLYSRFTEFRLERIATLVQFVALELPQVRWLIVGRGWQSEEQTLEAHLKLSDLDQYVRFAGWIPFEQLPLYFAAVDVAVYPYDDTVLNHTKCSVKLIDLLAAGLPVVADAVGQNCEYIQPNQSGLLVSAEDDTAFGQALITMLREPDTRQVIGRAAAQFMQDKFSWSHLAQTAERAYH